MPKYKSSGFFSNIFHTAQNYMNCQLSTRCALKMWAPCGRCAVTRRQQNQNAFPKMISVGDDRSTKSGKVTGYLIFSISDPEFMMEIFHIFCPCCFIFQIRTIPGLLFRLQVLHIPHVPEKYQITLCT